MAQIELTWLEKRKRTKIVEIPLDVDYLDGFDISDETDLVATINDYYNWNKEDNFLMKYLTKEEQQFYYDDLEAEVLNWDELEEKYSYLIRGEEPKDCCSQYTSNYCPECGKKLK
jgi:hypothetical protein